MQNYKFPVYITLNNHTNK